MGARVCMQHAGLPSRSALAFLGCMLLTAGQSTIADVEPQARTASGELFESDLTITTMAAKGTFDGSVLLLEGVLPITQWLVSDAENMRYGSRLSTQYLASDAFCIDGKWLGSPDAVLIGMDSNLQEVRVVVQLANAVYAAFPGRAASLRCDASGVAGPGALQLQGGFALAEFALGRPGDLPAANVSAQQPVELADVVLVVDNARAPPGAFAWKALRQAGRSGRSGVMSFLGSTGNCPANPNCPWGLASSIACGCSYGFGYVVFGNSGGFGDVASPTTAGPPSPGGNATDAARQATPG